MSPTITKDRKIILMSNESEVILDPERKLAEEIKKHLGMCRNESFNEDLTLKRKEEAGRRLLCLLDMVVDGAMVPLMHFTLNKAQIQKLAALQGDLLSLLLEEHLRENRGEMFTSLSNEDKDRVGDRLRCLLRGVAGGAIVPLMNHTLNSEEVGKLSVLKGVQVDEDRASPPDNLVEEGVPDDNSQSSVHHVKEEDDDMDIEDNLVDVMKTEYNLAATMWNRELEMRNSNKGETQGSAEDEAAIRGAEQENDHHPAGAVPVVSGIEHQIPEPHQQKEEFSFYGAAADTVDMSRISTRIKMGGAEITLSAKRVVQMAKLSPRVLVRDCARQDGGIEELKLSFNE